MITSRNNSNKRKTTRVAYAHPIILYKGRNRFSGLIDNISLKGVYVKTDKRNGLRVGDSIEYKIILPGTRPRITVQGQAKIVRKSGIGFGIYFIRMRDVDLTHIRRLIDLNLMSAAKTGAELKSFLT